MLVVDASALAEYLIGSSRGVSAAGQMWKNSGSLHLPHLAIAETISVFRSWVARGELSDQRARGAVDDLSGFPATRYSSEPLLGRIWELRHNLTSYDAHYIALAEALDAPLLTADRRIARAGNHHASVTLIE